MPVRLLAEIVLSVPGVDLAGRRLTVDPVRMFDAMAHAHPLREQDDDDQQREEVTLCRFGGG